MIRTLLIDDRDSSTLNLFHLLAEVNGYAPTLAPNDWAKFEVGVLGEFDNVVISPGPGTPERSADFGICAEIIAQSPIPVLGVCLGHQGIATVPAEWWPMHLSPGTAGFRRFVIPGPGSSPGSPRLSRRCGITRSR